MHTLPALPGLHPYADRGQISGLYERGVLVAADIDDLHEPSEPISSR